jgi:hypothetical protein
MSTLSFVRFNWFPNNTCQLFYSFSVTYEIQSMPQAQLYFSQGILPNKSQYCMPNTNNLLNKLDTANKISANIPSPRCIVLDNHGYI